MEIEITNHQEKITISDASLASLHKHALQALPLILSQAQHDAPLLSLDLLEIAIVDDETSAATHEEFMDIEGATDVITFHHGEIVISAEVAERQAKEYGDTFYHELFRYIIHGMLHLAGYDDLTENEFEDMKERQESVLKSVCTCELER